MTFDKPRNVYVSDSQLIVIGNKSVGEGLFAKRFIPPNRLVVTYGGHRIKSGNMFHKNMTIDDKYGIIEIPF